MATFKPEDGRPFSAVAGLPEWNDFATTRTLLTGLAIGFRVQAMSPLDQWIWLVPDISLNPLADQIVLSGMSIAHLERTLHLTSFENKSVEEKRG